MRSRSLVCILLVFSSVSSVYGTVDPPESSVAGKVRMMQLEKLPYLAPEVRTHEFTSYKRTAEFGDFDSWLFDLNGERVMFAEEGPGCVTRLWVTAVNDEASLLKFYFDGEKTASFSITPQQLFRSGQWPYPLVAGPDQSAGGRICYIPILFSQSLVITDAGDVDVSFYNITCERYTADTAVESWDSTEDYSDVTAYLNLTGQDPKPDAGNLSCIVSNSILPETGLSLLNVTGTGVVQSIELDLPPVSADVLSQCAIRMVFDGQTTVDEVPLGEFFGSAVGEVNWTSLVLGMRTNGNWYCYFPMPYWESAEITLLNGSEVVLSNVSADVEYNPVETYDQEKAGYFCARRQSRFFSKTDGDMILFDESGTAGRFVGLSLYMEGDGTGAGGMMYLEGDARIYIDGAEAPSIHGTGNEDWFNAAFYYNDYADKGANQEAELFSMPYHGLPAKHHYDPPWNCTQAYRFNLADPIEFSSSKLFTMEAGGYPRFTEGYYSAIGYSYQKFSLLACSEQEFFTANSSTSFAYSCDGVITTNSARFITPHAEISAPTNTWAGFSNVLHSSFVVDIPPANRGILLQSLSDFSSGTNSALVTVNEAFAGGWHQLDTNFFDSSFGWGINEILLPPSITAGTNRLTVSITYSAPATEYRFRIVPLAARSVGDSLFSEWMAQYAPPEKETKRIEDFDHDGQPNLLEYFYGTSPVDADQPPKEQCLQLNSQEVVFSRRADFLQCHLFYTLQQCTNLVSGIWADASLPETTGVSEDGIEWVTNRVWNSSGQASFFRLRVGLE